MSETIYTLIPRVMADIGAVGKDRKNEAQGYKFRGIEDMYQAAHPAMVRHGVFCCPKVVQVDSQERLTKSGAPSIRVTMTVCHRFYAPDGSFVEVTTCGEGIDSSDKATNKATSAAMKYAFIELFSIPTQDIEDGDRTDPEAGNRQTKTVPRLTEPVPIVYPETLPGPSQDPTSDGRIDAEQAKKLHTRFRNALSPELKPKADAFLYDFLNLKKCLDATGRPSAMGIKVAEFPAIGKAAVEWAKTLSAKSAFDSILTASDVEELL